MRVRVTKEFDWRQPNAAGVRAMVSFPVGEWTVTREQGEAIIAAKCGEEIDKPRKGDK